MEFSLQLSFYSWICPTSKCIEVCWGIHATFPNWLCTHLLLKQNASRGHGVWIQHTYYKCSIVKGVVITRLVYFFSLHVYWYIVLLALFILLSFLCRRCHCCLFQSGVIEQHDVTLKWDWTRSRKSWRTYRSVVEAFLLTRQENRANPPTARLPLLAYLLPLFYEQHEEHECRSENCCIPAGNCRHRRHGCEKRTRKASWNKHTSTRQQEHTRRKNRNWREELMLMWMTREYSRHYWLDF